MRRVGLPLAAVVALAIVPSAASADSSWEGRLAPAAETELEIARFEAQIASDPEALAPRWKLLRSLHYLSEFTDASEARRDAAVDRGVSIAADATEALEVSGEASDPSEAARVYFWSAIVWGARGQRVGLLTIVRQGVARRMYEYASRALELDPTIERGGAYRLLSRLHADLPRVPFVSGWVDRDRALPLAERALAVSPDDPGNQLVLALALLERAPDRREEARALLEAATAATPRPELRAEDLAIAEQAADRLAELESSS